MDPTKQSEKLKEKISPTKTYTPKNAREERLMKAMTILSSDHDTAQFLRDIMTESEIEEFSNRLEIAVLLKQGMSYQKIADQVGTSTTTVTRVAQWLFKGCGGYAQVLEKLGADYFEQRTEEILIEKK
jgi:TrpR-related protein YerC/YecD